MSRDMRDFAVARGEAPRLPYELEAAQRAFLRKVYQWMGLGLALTGIVAAAVAGSPAALRVVFGTPFLLVGLVVAELALVVWLSARATRMAPGAASAVFLLYSALNGVTLSAVFLAYTRESIASTFLVTAGTFGATSLYGYATRRDLSALGGFLFMGLVGLLIASLVNAFLASPMIYWITSYVGVGIFVGLTAYDTQRLKEIGASADPDDPRTGSLGVVGALRLYLDFVNLFLYLLRLFGRRR